MKICICGSIAFFDEMVEAKNVLESMGHEVDLPMTEIENDKGEMISISEYYRIRKECNDNNSWIWRRKKEAIIGHFKKIQWSDAVLVLNHEKNGIVGYVGANTLIEMGLALWLKKRIYLLNDVPEIGSKEEILAMQPILLEGNLENIL